MRAYYEDRIPTIEAVLRRLGRAATVAELYEELKGDARFEKPRRVAATFRYDQRQPQHVFVREGKDRIALRNPTNGAPKVTNEVEESRVYERGQTVVPKRIRDAMAIEEGSTLVWDVHDGTARVTVIPKDPIGALRGILKDKGPSFEQFLADRNAERQRERALEANEERRWRTYSTRRR